MNKLDWSKTRWLILRKKSSLCRLRMKIHKLRSTLRSGNYLNLSQRWTVDHFPKLMRRKVRQRWKKVTMRVHKGKRSREKVERNLRTHKILSKIKEIKVPKAIIQLSQNNNLSTEVQSMQNNTNKDLLMIATDTLILGILNLNSYPLHHLNHTLTTLMSINPLQFLIRLTCTLHPFIHPWWFQSTATTTKKILEKRKRGRRKRSDTFNKQINQWVSKDLSFLSVFFIGDSTSYRFFFLKMIIVFISVCKIM